MPGSSYQCEGYPMPFPSPLLEAPGMPAVILPALQFRGCHGSSFRLLPAHTSPSQSPSECREAERCSPVGFQLHQSNRRSRSRWALSPGTSGSTTTPPRTAWTRPATRSGNASKASRKSCSPCSGRSRRRPFEETTATPSTSE